jgi:hypothetical protein
VSANGLTYFDSTILLRKEPYTVKSTFGLQKVIGGVVLTILLVFCFLFIKPTLYIDWFDNGSVTTNLLLFVAVIGILVIVFYHIFYPSNVETTKLSLTAVLTVIWLSLILFYPFNPPATASDAVKSSWPGGAMGFFALIGGLGICVLWVRFFSDEIVA